MVMPLRGATGSRLAGRLLASIIVVCSTSAVAALGLPSLAAATGGGPTACVSPPPNFTALTATPQELSEYGLPQRPPESTNGAIAAWATAVDHAKHRVCATTANSGGTSPTLGSATHPPSKTRSERIEGADAAALAAGHWVLLPSAPITPRTGAATLWTGKQLFVWGGTTPTKTYANGAVLDPTTKTWRLLPRSPLRARALSASTIAGSSVFIWGGRESRGRSTTVYGDGALYHLRSRTWTLLPPSPLAPRWNASALWTGSEVVVLGGWAGGQTHPHVSLTGAAYNPASDSWSTIPRIPNPGGSVAAVDAGWTGHELDVLVLSHPSFGKTNFESEAWTPGHSMWHALPTSGAEKFSLSTVPLWTGSSFYFLGSHTCAHWPWGGGAPSCVPNPHQAWRATAVTPRDAAARSTSATRRVGIDGPSAWTGRSLVDFAGRVGVALDVSTGAWLSIPEAPLLESTTAEAIWTGKGLILWGRAPGGSRQAEELLPEHGV